MNFVAVKTLTVDRPKVPRLLTAPARAEEVPRTEAVLREREPAVGALPANPRGCVARRRTQMPSSARLERPEGGTGSEVANLGIVRPPLVYLTAIGLGVALHLAWPVGLAPLPAGPRVGMALGVSLVVLAVVLFVSAVRTFRAAGTPIPGDQPTTTIVWTGPYRVSRNPIYLSFSVLQAGLALWIDSLWLAVALMPAAALMALVVVPREERYLTARFPTEYSRYRASVRRWL